MVSQTFEDYIRHPPRLFRTILKSQNHPVSILRIFLGRSQYCVLSTHHYSGTFDKFEAISAVKAGAAGVAAKVNNLRVIISLVMDFIRLLFITIVETQLLCKLFITSWEGFREIYMPGKLSKNTIVVAYFKAAFSVSNKHGYFFCKWMRQRDSIVLSMDYSLNFMFESTSLTLPPSLTSLVHHFLC